MIRGGSNLICFFLRSAVFLIIVTNNFAEIKSTVFKRYEALRLSDGGCVGKMMNPFWRVLTGDDAYGFLGSCFLFR